MASGSAWPAKRPSSVTSRPPQRCGWDPGEIRLQVALLRKINPSKRLAATWQRSLGQLDSSLYESFFVRAFERKLV
jgi:hypothetical protein